MEDTSSLTNNYFNTLEKVTEYNKFKDELYSNWNDIEITQINNFDNITINAREEIEVVCNVKLPNILPDNIEAQVYYGKVMENRNIRKHWNSTNDTYELK